MGELKTLTCLCADSCKAIEGEKCRFAKILKTWTKPNRAWCNECKERNARLRGAGACPRSLEKKALLSSFFIHAPGCVIIYSDMLHVALSCGCCYCVKALWDFMLHCLDRNILFMLMFAELLKSALRLRHNKRNSSPPPPPQQKQAVVLRVFQNILQNGLI